MFSKSPNPPDLPQKSTIRALFKAKSFDLKTYSLPSKTFSNAVFIPAGAKTSHKQNLASSDLCEQIVEIRFFSNLLRQLELTFFWTFIAENFRGLNDVIVLKSTAGRNCFLQHALFCHVYRGG